MIYRIDGTVHKIDNLRVILKTGDIFYEIITPSAPGLKPGTRASLYTYLSIKNEQLTFYGFTEEEARDLFLRMIKLQGVGEKMALRILAALSPSEVLEVVEKEDVKTLSSIKGVGKKRAERLIFELKGALPKTLKEDKLQEVQGAETLKGALVALGLKEDEAEGYVKKYIEKHGTIASIEDAIKEIVKHK